MAKQNLWSRNSRDAQFVLFSRLRIDIAKQFWRELSFGENVSKCFKMLVKGNELVLWKICWKFTTIIIFFFAYGWDNSEKNQNVYTMFFYFYYQKCINITINKKNKKCLDKNKKLCLYNGLQWNWIYIDINSDIWYRNSEISVTYNKTIDEIKYILKILN